MSETAEKILKLKADMEGFARQRVTGFIHNSNLQDWASARDLRDGYPVIREASEASGIPAGATSRREGCNHRKPPYASAYGGFCLFAYSYSMVAQGLGVKS